MSRIIIRWNPASESWQASPWNDGHGGDYEDLGDVLLDQIYESFYNETDVDLLDPPSQADIVCYVADLDADGLAISVVGLAEAEKQPGNRRVRVGTKREHGFVEDLPSHARRTIVMHHMLCLFVRDAEKVVVWPEPEAYAEYVADLDEFRQKQAAGRPLREAAKLDEERTNRQAELNRKRSSGAHFVNPYTFAPLPVSIQRDAPRGHTSMASGGLSGWFDWELRFTTPLVLPAEQEALHKETLLYPGSSLRGVLRNLHESIAGGCLRILEDDYLPVHREPMSAYNATGDKLAVVTAVHPMTGAVTEVRVTSRVIWVHKDALARAFAAVSPHSGSLLHVDASRAADNTRTRRKELLDPTAVTPGTDWVVHLTASTDAREKHPYFAAVGELNGGTRSIDSQTWKRFVHACEGSGDLVTAPVTDTHTHAPGSTHWPSIEVRHQGKRIGYRRKVDGWLAVGDTVWVTARGELKMAALWRREGRFSVADRVPAALRACQDPASLCPTCQVFGSIDNERNARHEQSGYASHVRVNIGRSVALVTTAEVDLPPLRSPKPTSGGFYLTTPDDADLSASINPTHVTRAHWGSALDDPEPRSVRGRKFYWHGQNAGGRQQPRDHNESQNATAQTVGPGTSLRTRVCFDNLSDDQLGWLLAAADPSTFFDRECAIHVGGGKPLGFGSAVPSVHGLRVFSAESRYAGDALNYGKDESIVRARGTVEAKGLTGVFLAVRAILNPDAVPADRLWYPTPGNFLARGTPDARKAFDESFEWFKDHSGARTGDLVPLPQATDPDQFLSGRHA